MSRLHWLVSATVAVLLVSGCSGDEPAAGPRPASSPPGTTPVTTTSPTPSPPELPARAQENTKAGAVAFAHHFIELVNFASASGDARGVLSGSTGQCAACEEIAKFIRVVYRDGGEIRGGDWRPLSYSVIPSGQGQWLIAVEIRAEKQTYRLSGDGPPKMRTGGRYTISLYMTWRPTGWHVQKMVSTQ